MVFFSFSFLLNALDSLIVKDTGDKTSGNRTTTLTDVEALAGLGSHGVVCLQDHLNVIAGLHSARDITVLEAEIRSLIYLSLTISSSFGGSPLI